MSVPANFSFSGLRRHQSRQDGGLKKTASSGQKPWRKLETRKGGSTTGDERKEEPRRHAITYASETKREGSQLGRLQKARREHTVYGTQQRQPRPRKKRKIQRQGEKNLPKSGEGRKRGGNVRHSSGHGRTVVSAAIIHESRRTLHRKTKRDNRRKRCLHIASLILSSRFWILTIRGERRNTTKRLKGKGYEPGISRWTSITD